MYGHASNVLALMVDAWCVTGARWCWSCVAGTDDRGPRGRGAVAALGQARRLASEVLFILQGKLHEFSPAEVFFENAKTDAARAFLNGDIIE